MSQKGHSFTLQSYSKITTCQNNSHGNQLLTSTKRDKSDKMAYSNCTKETNVSIKFHNILIKLGEKFIYWVWKGPNDFLTYLPWSIKVLYDFRMYLSRSKKVPHDFLWTYFIFKIRRRDFLWTYFKSRIGPHEFVWTYFFARIAKTKKTSSRSSANTDEPAEVSIGGILRL